MAGDATIMLRRLFLIAWDISAGHACMHGEWSQAHAYCHGQNECHEFGQSSPQRQSGRTPARVPDYTSDASTVG
jgi:hypothetical protein